MLVITSIVPCIWNCFEKTHRTETEILLEYLANSIIFLFLFYEVDIIILVVLDHENWEIFVV